MTVPSANRRRLPSSPTIRDETVIGVARDLQPVLEHLPVERLDLDLRRLADVDVFLFESGTPGR